MTYSCDFSCISRDLIIAKFEAYGFHIDVLNYFYSTFCKPLQAILMITAQKMKFSIKDFFSKCYQICTKQRIWSHLFKKSLMENSIFPCSVCYISNLVVFPFYILVLGQQFIVLLRFFTGNCEFGHIYWRNPSWKTSFLCIVIYFASSLF